MTSRRNQREAKARLILGVVLSDVCGEECAAELFRQALGYDPCLVAAHVRLGISHAYAEDYAAMLDSFAEALRLDPRAARVVYSEAMDEAKRIRTILFPPEPDEETRGYVSTMPAEFIEAGELINSAIGHLAAGRDEEAARALERSLTLDETNRFAVAALTLTYMLPGGSAGRAGTGNNASVLSEIDAALAKMIFNH
jgi:tetratricopeptide (TPR) repeat protein